MRTSSLVAPLLLLLSASRPAEPHARLMEPASRASMWRVGFPTPRDEDDNQSYCGGYGVHFGQNEGKCGICGDPWHVAPRPHEAPGGVYATGIISKTYRQGSLIPVIIDITANHQGRFNFNLCPHNDIFVDPDQSCFDALPLMTMSEAEAVSGAETGRLARGHKDFAINDYETGLRLLYVQLPMAITCQQCIMQWSYVAGNNWGVCENGTSGLGCGPQETFRACADISIEPHPLLAKLKGQSKPQSQPQVEAEEEEDAADPDAYLEDLAGESLPSAAISDAASSLEQKEELLRRKKLLLEQALNKLRELIMLSQQPTEEKQQQPRRSEDEWRAEEANRKPLAPNKGDNEVDNGADSEAWWKHIVSNRHR